MDRKRLFTSEVSPPGYAVNAPILVGLVQINEPYMERHFLPYSVGVLQAYVQQQPDLAQRYLFLPSIYFPIRIQQALEWLQPSQIVGFSAYLWNYKRTLMIAQRLKEQRPHVLVIFGGPHVPTSSEAFLRENPYIDICCHGEGEMVFSAILSAYPARDWENIPGVSYLDEKGNYHQNPQAPRIKDLSQMPSPYLAGVFDSLLRQTPTSDYWGALWETNRGCPFSCTFCDWGSAINSKIYPFPLERLTAELEWFGQHRMTLLAGCDANFGLLKRDVAIAESLVAQYRQCGYPQQFIINTTKNQVERAYDIFQILKYINVNGVTLSMQSLDTETLKRVKRDNISLDFYRELQHRLTRDGIPTYTDMIIALPGETYDSFRKGVSATIENGQHRHIHFMNATILPNAEMSQPAYRERYGLVTIETRFRPYDWQEGDGICELQEVVITTDTLPIEDWLKTRVFAWITGFLYFDAQLLQIVLLVLNELTHIPYHTWFELFMAAPAHRYPLLASITQFFVTKAQSILEGGSEYCIVDEKSATKRWTFTERYRRTQLFINHELDDFYRESEQLLADFVQTQELVLPPGLLHELFVTNDGWLRYNVLKTTYTLPATNYNILSFYHSVLRGERIPLLAQEANSLPLLAGEIR